MEGDFKTKEQHQAKKMKKKRRRRKKLEQTLRSSLNPIMSKDSGQDVFSFMFVPFLLLIFCSANSRKQFPVLSKVYFHYLHGSHY